MKRFLRIRTLNPDKTSKTISVFLLTGNTTAIIFEGGETKVYFKKCNPFTFIRLYLTYDEYIFLTSSGADKNTARYIRVKEIIKEDSIFSYESFVNNDKHSF